MGLKQFFLINISRLDRNIITRLLPWLSISSHIYLFNVNVSTLKFGWSPAEGLFGQERFDRGCRSGFVHGVVLAWERSAWGRDHFLGFELAPTCMFPQWSHRSAWRCTWGLFLLDGLELLGAGLLYYWVFVCDLVARDAPGYLALDDVSSVLFCAWLRGALRFGDYLYFILYAGFLRAVIILESDFILRRCGERYTAMIPRWGPA